MAKKQFKTESKRLLDLMVNSIYTHKDIFLRELISNASDAVDKLAYLALTDEKVGLNRSDFQITLVPDKASRTLTISDNGMGMTAEELEKNLGTIAKSGSLQFKQALDKGEAKDVDIIGQFGVGFYSAFMVADEVTVISRAYGEDQAHRWHSKGADGYTVDDAQRDAPGTDVILKLKENADGEDYDRYLDPHVLMGLVKKHSDYIRYPIRMELEHTHEKPAPDPKPEDYKPEYETHREWETLNSMQPLWNRPKKDVKREEYDQFYQEKFGDWQPPLAVEHLSAEGAVSYKALLYIPSQAPYDYFTRDFEKGLQLYSSGVLIMDKCGQLLGEHFRFVRGVVDSPDLSLNISREILQQDRQLTAIAANLEKKIKGALEKLLKDDRDKYLTFWKAFGPQLKYGVVNEFGTHKELLKDLLLFWSSKAEGMSTLREYRDRMPESQQFIYYVRGESKEKAAALPQTERILDAGFEVLYLTEDIDEFAVQTLNDYDGKVFKSVSDPDALPETDAQKEEAKQRSEEAKPLLDFCKETLGDAIKEARISRILKSAPVCMTTDGPMSFEMERYFEKVEGQSPMKAERILELNPEHPAVQALQTALDTDKDKAARYVQLLHAQACLAAGLELANVAEYTDLVCSLME